MIPGDIGAELARVLQAMVAAGELPSLAASRSAAGTWRPAPAEAGGGPGTYATSLPLTLARMARRAAAPVAGQLAAGLVAVPWISSARVTGGGYLTVTVTAAHLSSLPARIIGAGPGVAVSGALAGTRMTAPRPPDPATAPDWGQAWRTQRDALAGRLADAAGAEVLFFDPEREPTRAPTTQASAGAAPVTKADTGGEPVAQAARGSVAAAVAWHGADAVRYALARTSAPRAGAISRQLGLPLDLTNPFVAVRYAHADAASVLRWAADLGLAPGQPEVQPERAPNLLPPELVLVDAMSWLPERVAAAARRRRPSELAAFLETLAGAWLNCADSCPALPFRGHGAPAALAGAQTAARLELSHAARIVLGTGLVLLGISAPARM